MPNNKVHEVALTVRDRAVDAADLALHGVDQALSYIDHHPIYNQVVEPKINRVGAAVHRLSDRIFDGLYDMTIKGRHHD